jgi:hypothetical protein
MMRNVVTISVKEEFIRKVSIFLNERLVHLDQCNKCGLTVYDFTAVHMNHLTCNK